MTKGCGISGQFRTFSYISRKPWRLTKRSDCSEPSCVRLETTFEGELVSVETLNLASLVESNVGEREGTPGEKTSDGGLNANEESISSDRIEERRRMDCSQG